MEIIHVREGGKTCPSNTDIQHPKHTKSKAKGQYLVVEYWFIARTKQHHNIGSNIIMWGVGNPAASMNAIYGGSMMTSAVATPAVSASTAQQKNDIFVGNLAFNTTEEQLHTIFSEIGRVINVRMVTDQETGKMRGFAFVEFEQAQDALSAIRNMNEYELNGRKLRVNFSNMSHLEALAGKLGMDIPNNSVTTSSSVPGTKPSIIGKGFVSSSGATTSTTAVADALKGLSKGEMYDVVAKLKEIADRDPDEARRVLAGHPQLPEALLFLMSKLDMIKVPLPTVNGESGVASTLQRPEMLLTTGSTVAVAGATTMTAAVRAADPRAAAATAAATARIDPRQQAAAMASARIDPRQQPQQQRAIAAGNTPQPGMVYNSQPQLPPPPPPPQQQQQLLPPPPPPPPPRMGQLPPPPLQPQYMQQQQPPQMGGLNLDPALVQQVLSLTPQQISQLPIDKQQSIFQLRQQITGQPM